MIGLGGDAALGAFFAFGASCTWAMGSTVYSRLSRESSAFAVNLARAWIALPLFLVGALITGADWSTIGWGNVGWMTLSMAASYGLGDVIFLWSTRSLGVPGALAVASCYPLWTAFAGILFMDQSLFPLQWVGLLITLTGAALVILNSPRYDGGAGRLGNRWVGVLLAVLTSFCWATNGFAVAKGTAGLNSFLGNTIRMAIGVLLSIGLRRVMSPAQPMWVPKKSLKTYFWLFACESFGGSFFYMGAFQKAPLVIAATLTSLAPVLAVPVAWAMKVEKISLWRTVGVVLVVSGLCAMLG